MALYRKILKRGEVGVMALGALLVSGFAVKKGVDAFFGKGAGTFMVQLATNPTQVGAFAPSSKYVALEMTSAIRQAVAKKSGKELRILEVGAGSGTFTRRIIEDAGQNYHLDVIEINPDFCKVLRNLFGHLPCVKIHQIDILQWKPEEPYDVIISALPFNVFDEHFLKKIFHHYEQLLIPGGDLSYFEIRGVMRVRKLFLYGKKMAELQKKLDVIKEFRERYLQRTVTVLANLPPVYVHHLRI